MSKRKPKTLKSKNGLEYSIVKATAINCYDLLVNGNRVLRRDYRQEIVNFVRGMEEEGKM